MCRTCHHGNSRACLSMLMSDLCCVTGGQKAEAAPAAGAQSGPKAPAPRYKIIDYGHADFGDATLRDDGMAMEGPYFDPQDG